MHQQRRLQKLSKTHVDASTETFWEIGDDQQKIEKNQKKLVVRVTLVGGSGSSHIILQVFDPLSLTLSP